MDKFLEQAQAVESLQQQYAKHLDNCERLQTAAELYSGLWQLAHVHEQLVRNYYMLIIAIANEANDHYESGDRESAGQLYRLLAGYTAGFGQHFGFITGRAADA